MTRTGVDPDRGNGYAPIMSAPGDIPAPSRRTAWLIPAVFAIALAVLAGMVLLIHAKAERTVATILSRELATQSNAAVEALEQALARQMPAAGLGDLLRRLRDTGHLGSALVADVDGNLLVAGDGEMPVGTPVAVTSATPALTARILAGERRIEEEVSLLGEPFRRIYLPVRVDGRVRGVLVSEAHDASADGLAALHWPLWSGLGAAVLAAAILAWTLRLALRTAAHAQAAIARQQQLAAAGTLAASIAHEVRNPLQMILAATQLLERQTDPRERAELVTTIAEEVRRADDQLDAFLDLTRETPLRQDRTDLGALLVRTGTLLNARAAQARIRLEVAPPPAVVAVVDGRRIGQALVNLGLNAIQAIESAQRTGTVRLALTCDGARREARFTVHDDGPGIPAALRDAVLDPFVSTRCDGTGLGLPQAKRAAERHGGRLELADADGGGLIATLVLPLGESGQCAS